MKHEVEKTAKNCVNMKHNQQKVYTFMGQNETYKIRSK